MNRSLRKHTLCILTFVSLVFAFAVPGMAQTTDTDTAEVSLVVTRSSETPTETVTPSETPTATATETPTPSPTEVANEDCELSPDNAQRIDPNSLASQQAPLGSPCNPLTNKVAGPVTQLPDTGAGNQDGSVEIGSAILVVTGIFLIGSAAAMVKQRS